MFSEFEVLVVYRNLLIDFKLPDFVLSICVVEAEHHFGLTCNFEIVFVVGGLFREAEVRIKRGLGRILGVVAMNLNAFTQTDTVQSYQSNLVVSVQTIHMALMDHEFEKCTTSVNMNRLEFSRLEATPFVVVQRKEAQFSKLDLT